MPKRFLNSHSESEDDEVTSESDDNHTSLGAKSANDGKSACGSQGSEEELERKLQSRTKRDDRSAHIDDEEGLPDEDKDEVDSLDSVNSEVESRSSGHAGSKRMLESTVGDDESYESSARAVFGHALLSGLSIPQCSEAEWQSTSTVILTTTRNTPRTVLDAIDRQLRFGRPALSVQEIADKYRCIRLVVTRRVAVLQSKKLFLSGLRAPAGAVAQRSASGEQASRSAPPPLELSAEKLQALDIVLQTSSPPMTVSAVALELQVPVESVLARVAHLRRSGVQTSGVQVAETQGGANRGRGAGRPFRAFDGAEDALILRTVAECARDRSKVPWAQLDTKFGRNLGACRQRWQKGLKGRIIDLGMLDKQESTGSQGSTAWARYQQCMGEEDRRQNGETDSGGGTTEEVQAVLTAMLRAIEGVHVAGQAAGTVRSIAAPQPASLGPIPGERARVRNFTVEEDALIVQVSLRPPVAGKTKAALWEALDLQLGRSVGACRSRWQRILLPKLKSGEFAETVGRQESNGSSISSSRDGNGGRPRGQGVDHHHRLVSHYQAIYQLRETLSSGTSASEPRTEISAVLQDAVAAVELLLRCERMQSKKAPALNAARAPAPTPTATATGSSPRPPPAVAQSGSPTGTIASASASASSAGQGDALQRVAARWAQLPQRTPMQQYTAIADALANRTESTGQSVDQAGATVAAAVRMVLACALQVVVERHRQGSLGSTVRKNAR